MWIEVNTCASKQGLRWGFELVLSCQVASAGNTRVFTCLSDIYNFSLNFIFNPFRACFVSLDVSFYLFLLQMTILCCSFMIHLENQNILWKRGKLYGKLFIWFLKCHNVSNFQLVIFNCMHLIFFCLNTITCILFDF